MRTVAVLLLTAALIPLAAASSDASEEAGAIWCKEPTTIGIGQRQISTPEICVPGP